ncbi:MAG: imelysin family protein [Pseudomonadota bacterium]
MRFLTLFFAVFASTAHAQADLDGAVEQHILPGYALLSEQTEILSATAQSECDPASEALRAAYHDAFDAWVGVSHLRFGPSETDQRAFALAFWPDPRGSTPKALSRLIAAEDSVVESASDFATVSVAGRGFYALEFLLFDPQFADAGPYGCTLIQRMTQDIAETASAIEREWRAGYADLILTAGANDTYRSEAEAARQLFTALTTGLEFTATARLERPMGTFERPRPNRAEARRSERSLRHVFLALQASQDLSQYLAGGNAELAATYERAVARTTALDDPALAGVATPSGRLRVEAILVQVNAVRDILTEEVGPTLGIAAGFNALDGD